MLFGSGCGGGGAGTTSRDGGAADAGADGPILDPRLFDCTFSPDGKRVPERASPVPVGCALDPKCRTPQVAGHRGAGGMLGALAPEDTLAAYRAAIALGVEFVETDPRPTADGVLINLHDPTVDRTTDGNGAVDQMTLARVQSLRVKADGLAGDFSCERVPAFVDVLRTCRGRVVVLVDANKTDRVDLLVAAIRDADAIEWALFDTSDVGKIDAALKIEPRLHIHIRPRTIGEITTQLDHFAPRLPAIVELQAEDRKAGAPLVHARGTRVLTDVFVEDAAAALQGNLSLYGKALDDGADILQTDRPDLVIRLLRTRGAR